MIVEILMGLDAFLLVLAIRSRRSPLPLAMQLNQLLEQVENQIATRVTGAQTYCCRPIAWCMAQESDFSILARSPKSKPLDYHALALYHISGSLMLKQQ